MAHPWTDDSGSISYSALLTQALFGADEFPLADIPSSVPDPTPASNGPGEFLHNQGGGPPRC